MADRKVTELDSLASPNQKDLLLIVDDPTGTPVSKKVTLYTLFGNIPANTSISGTLTVGGNTTISGSKTTISSGVVTLSSAKNVTSNNATTVLGSGMGGSIFWGE